MKLLMKKLLRKPWALFLSGVFILAFRSIVIGQGPPAVNQTEQSLHTINLIAQIIGWLVIVAGVVWYVFKAKDIEQVKQNRDTWKDLADARASQIIDLKNSNNEYKEAKKDLERDNEQIKKANFRLQAELEGKK